MSNKNTAVKNEVDAFQELYEANHQRVRCFIARIVGPQQAEDLVQVAFAKAAGAWSGFRGDAQASTWLYRIAANVVSDWLRSRSALEAKVTDQLPNALDHEAYAQSACSAAQGQPSPEQELVRKEMRSCIRRLIGQLPETHRSVLALAELGGFSDSEVAQSLGISRGNAKVRLHRARSQLKNALEAHCDFSRDDDNELVCEPKPAARDDASASSGHSGTAKSSGPANSEAL
jgi:RNA polymerase sigma-70 factor (ECF subfamily)